MEIDEPKEETETTDNQPANGEIKPQLYSDDSNASQPNLLKNGDGKLGNDYQSSSSLLDGFNSQVSTQLNGKNIVILVYRFFFFFFYSKKRSS